MNTEPTNPVRRLISWYERTKTEAEPVPNELYQREIDQFSATVDSVISLDQSRFDNNKAPGEVNHRDPKTGDLHQLRKTSQGFGLKVAKAAVPLGVLSLKSMSYEVDQDSGLVVKRTTSSGPSGTEDEQVTKLDTRRERVLSSGGVIFRPIDIEESTRLRREGIREGVARYFAAMDDEDIP